MSGAEWESLPREQLIALLDMQAQQLAAQAEQLSALSGQIEALTAQVGELTRRLGRNSSNSSLPPSADRGATGTTSKPKTPSRGSSGRKPGGQPGRVGRSRGLVEDPDEIIDHRPDTCAGCGDDLTDAEPAGMTRRQVVDIPDPVPPRVVEHRLHARRCRCGHTTTPDPPAGVAAPVQLGPTVAAVAVYLVVFQHVAVERAALLIADLCGITVSTGWVSGQVTKTATALAAATAAIVDRLKAGKVLGVDETSVSVGGVRYWLHVARTDTCTAYFLHPSRGREAVNTFGILPGYTGTIVHDALAVYDGPSYDSARHALCGAHLLRDLTAAAEDHPDQIWPGQAQDALLALNKLATIARDTGTPLDQAAVDRQIHWLDQAVKVGLHAHPRAAGRKQTPARNLLERVHNRRAEYLRYIHDLAVPFTNNGSERDLRPVKTQQKISGCYRSAETASDWLTIRGYVSTLRKHGHDILTALRDTLAGHPWIPPAPT